MFAEFILAYALAADAETNSTESNLLSTEVENVVNTDALSMFVLKLLINVSCAPSTTAALALYADAEANAPAAAAVAVDIFVV